MISLNITTLMKLFFYASYKPASKKTAPLLALTFTTIVLFLITSCGGGNSKPSTTVQPPEHATQQSLKFTLEKTNLAIDTNATYIATGKGTGAVTYTSSDTNIASVDNSGQVKGLNLGTAIITANIAADTTYPAGTASYTINVVLPAQTAVEDKRLTLYVDKVGVQPVSEQFKDYGPITSYFRDAHYVEFGAELGIGDLFGTVKVKNQNVNQLVIDEQNSYDSIQTILTFTTQNSGTFFRNYYNPGGTQVVLTHAGTFFLDDMPFKIIPDNFTNRTLALTFKQVTSTLTGAESPVVDQSFNTLFLDGNRINFSTANNSTWGANYSLQKDDEFNLTVKGTFENGRSYELHLKYDHFVLGTFNLNIDNGKAVATGTFTAAYSYPYVHNPLKGQFIKSDSISSTNTQITYPYSVYLPPNYATSGKQYPVVYILDGQWAEDLVYMMDDRNKDIIMVLIEQGPWDRRNIDYSPIGAENYIKFLKQEFIPLIESHYTTNQERTLFAGSLGGSLAAILLSKEPVGAPYFKNYIVGDGTFWYYPAEYLKAEEDRYKASNSMPINLFVSTTRQGQITSVLDAVKRYGDRHYQGMNIMYKEYQVQHVETGPLTFSDYMDVLY